LVAGDGALEEVREFLHVLQFHEREGILRAVLLGQAELGEPLVSHELEIRPGVGHRHPRYASRQHVVRELRLDVDRLNDHLPDPVGEILIEQLGLLSPDRADHLEREVHVCRLVPEHPIRAGRQSVQQSLRPQEIDIGERRKEEQPLDARSETDEVQHEGLAVLCGGQLIERPHAVHPAETEVGLGGNGGNVLDGRERRRSLVEVGDVVVEQRQVELHVQRFLVQLPAQIHTSLRAVDVLVQVQHQVVSDDRVTGGEECHEPVDEVPLGGRQLAIEVDNVVGEIDLLDRPRVADGVAVHVEELRVPHRPECQLEARVEDVAALGRSVAGGIDDGRAARRWVTERWDEFGF